MRYFRWTIKTIVMLTSAVAIYAAGYASQHRVAAKARAEAAESAREAESLRKLDALWRSIALNERPELENHLGAFERSLDGMGYCMPAARPMPHPPQIKRRYQRWKIEFSDDPSVFRSQLNALEIRLAIVSRGPDEVHVFVPGDKRDDVKQDAKQVASRSYLFLPISRRRLRQCLPAEVLSTDFSAAMLLFPMKTQSKMAILESREIQTMGTGRWLHRVDEVSFKVSEDPDHEIRLTGMTLRP